MTNLCPDCAAPINRLWKRCVSCQRAHDIRSNRVTRAASARVSYAVRTGKLARPTTLTCADCGQPATEYDHRDYSRPLQVEPVCHPCNKRRGPGLNHGRPALAERAA
jgi:hypothetical protein